ncbi:ABC transporter permease [Candidatus Enterococcus murrayae]|uniref:ABC transporter permease n=1 Tax=Candidatus Enterococcus murrayae TaxID=2815321 RepID=A0ABS3HMG8_9ENTE|nr:ABC transporter permease [Enterococcus sp. MJM16]MBO0454645.1 ABC transporter permease [Enterococcus sp. MJM16]
MIAIFRNNWSRTLENKSRFFVMLGLIICSICLAIFVSDKDLFATKIGVIGAPKQEVGSNHIKVEHLTQKPEKSSLALGMYDAIVDMRNGTPKISTFKGNTYKKELTKYFKDPEAMQADKKNNDEVDSTIIGYMLMFLLMTSVTNMHLFSEDKEKHVMERIITTPMGFVKLFVNYSLFSWLLLFIPTFLIVGSVSFMGFTGKELSLGDYSILIGAIVFFGTAFSIFNASLFKAADTANMFGSMIMIITTLLSGSLFSIDNGNQFFSHLIHWLPQKQFLELVKNIEAGQSYGDNTQRGFYLISISAILLTIAIFKTRKEYIRN